MRALLFAALFLGSASLFGGIATAQEAAATNMMQRLERLERDIQTLQVDLFKNSRVGNTSSRSSSTRAPELPKDDSLPADAATRLNDRVFALETSLGELTGRIEALQYEMEKTNQRMDKLITDLSARLMGQSTASQSTPQSAAPQFASSMSDKNAANSANSAPEAAVEMPAAPVSKRPQKKAIPSAMLDPIAGQSDAGESESAPDMASNTAPNTAEDMDIAPAQSAVELPRGTPTQKYDYAFGMLKKADFDRSAEAFGKFIQEYPDHELASNAQYWLAESYYAQENFTKAAVNFLKGYQNYPKSGKAPDSLLKLALSLSKLGSIGEACTTLSKLASEYPNAPAPVKQRGAAEWAKFNCANN